MSFLDNLENNLKALESREERATQGDLDRARAERNERLAAAPYAEALRNGPFTQALMGHATRLGFSKRAKVYISWLDSTLRLEAKQLRLDLRPTAKGVIATYLDNGEVKAEKPVDLQGDAESFARDWLSAL